MCGLMFECAMCRLWLSGAVCYIFFAAASFNDRPRQLSLVLLTL